LIVRSTGNTPLSSILRIVLLSLGFTAALGVRAERLGVEQAVQQALARSPMVLAADRRVEAAGASTEAARAGRWPRLDLRYTARRTDNPLEAFGDKLLTRSVTGPDFDPYALNHPDPSRLYATELLFTWPIYTGGHLSASISQAEHHERATRLARERDREQLAFQVRAAYYEAQAAAAGVDIATTAVEAARAHAATTARLAREGRAVASDPIAAELQRAGSESAREQAVTRAHRALEELRRLLALAAPSSLELDPWTPPAAAAARAGNVERALGQRKDLLAARALTEAGSARIEQARAAYHPQFSIAASESWYDRDPALGNRAQTIMGVVSINLFRGGADAASLGAARAEAGEQALRVEALRDAIRAEVSGAQRALEEAAARRALAARIVDQARENVRIVARRYGEGRTLLMELLQAERLLVEARREALEAALADAIGRARLDLAEGAGVGS